MGALIHMNGRVYDYNLGRFLSVDPFIQDPDNSQSMNPYSYIMNNPLAGTDPSGYISETECKASNGCYDDPEQIRKIMEVVKANNNGHKKKQGTYDKASDNETSDKIESKPEGASSNLNASVNIYQVSSGATKTASACGKASRVGCTKSNRKNVDDIDMSGAGLNPSTMADITPIVNDVMAVKEFIDVPSWINGAIVVVGMIPGPGDVAAKTLKGVKILRKTPVHHICTNKNCISAVTGGPWTPKFKEIFEKAGIKLNDAINKIAIPGHKGPHPQEYHEYVYDQLISATSGLKANSSGYTKAVSDTLGRISVEATTAGSQINKWLTKQ
jgi:RHS repeat-associated protein